MCKPADIITWTAYRDDPPVPLNATLVLTVNGKLLLRTYSANNEAGEEKLIARIEKSASRYSCLNIQCDCRESYYEKSSSPSLFAILFFKRILSHFGSFIKVVDLYV